MSDTLYAVPTVQEFRDEMPAFVDSSLFTDAVIQPYLDLAGSALNPQRWGQYYRNGIKWFVAHYLTLDGAAAKARGGLGGYGMVNSKSVGSVSISYDLGSGLEDNAGHWNLTLYGRLYIHQAKLVGMGGIQIGYGTNLRGVAR